jgi:hypothetical protein
MNSQNQRCRSIKIDECEATIFSDGSIIINTERKDLLCLDFHDILILFQETNKLQDEIRSNA